MPDPLEIPDELLNDPAYWRGLAAAVLDEAARTDDEAVREVLQAIAMNLERGAKDSEERQQERVDRTRIAERRRD